MSTRRVLVELSKVATRASIAKASPPPSLARLFSTQKDKINSESEKIKNSNEQRQNVPPKSLTEFPFPEVTDRAKINNNLNGVSLETTDLTAVVLENMASGLFSTKIVDIPSGTYAETSFVGSDVLISTYTDTYSSYTTKTPCGAYLFDARSGEQKQFNQFCSLMTPSYLVDGGDGNLKIWRRSDHSLMTINLPGGIKENGQWTLNNRSDCETMLIDGAYPLLIDLHTGEHRPIFKVEHSFDRQMYGTLIAYKVDYENPILRVYDYKSSEDLFERKITHSTEYYLFDNKTALAEFAVNKIDWMIMDIRGNVIKEGSVTSGEYGYSRNISVFKNFLIINQGPRIHFVDVNSGKKSASLRALGLASFNHVVGFDYGKFICSTEFSVQVVNFETPDPALNPPVKVVVINTDHTMSSRTGTIGEMINGLKYQYHDSRDLLEFQFHYDQSCQTAVIRLNETERLNYIYFPGVNRAERAKDAILARIYKACNFDIISVPDSTTKFYGRALLYKQELVNGKWLPVDFSVQEAEKFINSL